MNIQRQFAGIHASEQFICFQTFSMSSFVARDPKGFVAYAAPSLSHVEMGALLRTALGASRLVPDSERTEFCDLAMRDRMEREWIEQLKRNYGYKSKKAIFSSLHYCCAEQRDGTIELMPWIKDGRGGWQGTRRQEADHVVVNEHCSDEELGAAVRLALSRCG